MTFRIPTKTSSDRRDHVHERNGHASVFAELAAMARHDTVYGLRDERLSGCVVPHDGARRLVSEW
jgi:hypothetical protein